MIRWLSALMMIGALTIGGLPVVQSVAAQAGGVTINIRTVSADTGDSITSACFVLQDFSNIGCDENGDGLIRYEGVPAGDYLVDQVQPAAGYVTVNDIPITVDSSPSVQTFTIRLDPVSGSNVEATSDDGVTVFIHTIDSSNQFAITDVCYVLIDFSNEGCDDNGDGRVEFDGVPPGTVYTVTQTAGPTGYLPVGDFPIIANVHDAEQTFDVEMSKDRSTAETVDVSVVPYDATSGGGLTGACVIFYGGSLEGCDDNGDGRITFEGIPVGSYLLRETIAPNGYTVAHDRWIAVQVTGRTLYLPHSPSDQVEPADLVDVALVTRDPDTGELLTGACYIILDASIEGCDENDDGQVDYEDVVPGTYTIHQTTAPDGWDLIDDFEAQVSEFDPEQSILIKQFEEQYAPGFRNVSVAIYDLDSGQRVKGADTCVVLVDFSNEGCDENADGQIDFQDVPVGEYEIEATSLPRGYNVYFQDNLVVVEETNPLSIANALLVIVKP
jgi:uncharacterized surface anchored protein